MNKVYFLWDFHEKTVKNVFLVFQEFFVGHYGVARGRVSPLYKVVLE